ncbi:MAG: Stealth CR1 domain-containing protein [Alphaproteobacteria bacterium]|nr:Stealth CR1 domain-containing protein [Alphaproteobacteria bacterium]
MSKVFPIDIVYMWVDGADPKFAEQKALWQKKLGVMPNNDNHISRYIDNQELRYSLRSVATYAPWINKIYIVTNGQVPSWLDTTHPKIRIVTHAKIMPADSLPTFNSRAIESCIADIPELSEHFLLANDDCFISTPVEPKFFFDRKGRAIVRFLKAKFTAEKLSRSLYQRSIAYTLNLISQRYQKVGDWQPHHNIDAYRKSCYLDCINDFKDEFAALRRQKFRSLSVQRIIFALYAYVKNKAIMRIVNHSSYSLFHADSLYIDISSIAVMAQQIFAKTPHLLCINDEPYVKDAQRDDYKTLLGVMFPNAQPWEKLPPTPVDDEQLRKIVTELQKTRQAVRKAKIYRFIHWFFSVKNYRHNRKKHKVLTILGIRLSRRIE